MIASRSLDDLHPVVAAMARRFIAEARQHGIDLLVTSTYRDKASQDALYAQGRTKPGQRVTGARGGFSFHNWRVAFDVVPLRNGKPVWGTSGEDGALWQRVGVLGKLNELEWGGDWDFEDMPHFQFTGGLTIAQFQAGKTLPMEKK